MASTVIDDLSLWRLSQKLGSFTDNQLCSQHVEMQEIHAVPMFYHSKVKYYSSFGWIGQTTDYSDKKNRKLHI